jgi:hypothetical protein
VIRFNPTTSGAAIASLSIVSNDTDENPLDIALTGTGVTQNTAPVVVLMIKNYGRSSFAVINLVNCVTA